MESADLGAVRDVSAPALNAPRGAERLSLKDFEELLVRAMELYDGVRPSLQPPPPPLPGAPAEASAAVDANAAVVDAAPRLPAAALPPAVPVPTPLARALAACAKCWVSKRGDYKLARARLKLRR